MKLLLKLVVALVLVVVLAVVLVFWSIDRIAKTAIERGATFALGVPVTVDHARVRVLRGTFGMENLVVGNPEGYRTPHFMSLGEGGVAVSLASLRQDLVRLPTLGLRDISINLEKSGGKANYAVLMDNLKKLQSDTPATPPGDEDSTRFIVEELAIRNVTIHVDLLPVGGELTRANLRIDEIILRDIGSDSDRGVLIGELASVVLRAILQVAAEKGGGIIPTDILGDLNERIAQLGDLSGLTSKLGEGARGAVDSVTESLRDAASGATEGLGETIERGTDEIRRGLDGIGDRIRNR